MTVISLYMALAGIIGFLLSIYFFFYRLKLSSFWRWLGGIVGGLIGGTFMALVVLLILWPPMNDFVTLGGLGLIVVTIGTVLASSSKSEEAAIESVDPDFRNFRNQVLLGVDPTPNDQEP